MKKKGLNFLIQVAIDGSASAGRNTVAKIIAHNLGYIYIDTGAMYQACTLITHDDHVDYGGEKAVLDQADKSATEFKQEDGEQKVYVSDKDVSIVIRTPEITESVSQVLALKSIHEKVVELQHEVAGKHNVIMDDHDIGMTVLPDVEVKVFLIVSVASKAKRRFLDFQEKGIHQDLKDIEHGIKVRDYEDPHREISPLKETADAIELGTADFTIDEVVAKISEIIQKKQKN